MNEMIDLVKPKIVSVQIADAGGIIWINVDGVCRLRAQGAGEIEVVDQRKRPEKEDLK